MHGNNAAEIINQLKFYLGSITAKNDNVLGLAKNYFQFKPQEDQVATARTPTPSESVRSKKPLSQRSKIASRLRVSGEERQPLQKLEARKLNDRQRLSFV